MQAPIFLCLSWTDEHLLSPFLCAGLNVTHLLKFMCFFLFKLFVKFVRSGCPKDYIHDNHNQSSVASLGQKLLMQVFYLNDCQCLAGVVELKLFLVLLVDQEVLVLSAIPPLCYA